MNLAHIYSMPEFTVEEQAFIVQSYRNGVGSTAIARQLGVTTIRVQYLLCKLGVKSRTRQQAGRLRRRMTSEQEMLVLTLYDEGYSMTDIASAIGLDRSSIRACLTEHGRTIFQTAVYLRYLCNEHYFDEIDTEARAYWLGFIGADGSTSGGLFELPAALKDRLHIERFKQTIDFEGPLQIEDNDKYSRCKLRITSPTLVSRLKQLGIVVDKHLTLPWPDLNEPLLIHYLRGYFDGDGSFALSTCKDGRTPQITFGLLGNLQFLTCCQNLIMQRCELRRTKIGAEGPNQQIYKLAYCGNRQVARIANYIYQDATVYLARKRKVVEHLLGM